MLNLVIGIVLTVDAVIGCEVFQRSINPISIESGIAEFACGLLEMEPAIAFRNLLTEFEVGSFVFLGGDLLEMFGKRRDRSVVDDGVLLPEGWMLPAPTT